MGRANIPRPDFAAAEWMTRFARVLSADPGAYHVPVAAAAEVAGRAAAFEAARVVAVAEPTRTAGNVALKDAARAAAEAVCRRYYTQVKNDPDVDDVLKVKLAVRPVNRRRTRSAAPRGWPVLNTPALGHGFHVLRFSPSDAPSRRGRPDGAASIQLFLAVGDGRAAGPDDARLQGVHTADVLRVRFDPSDDGKVATYFARFAGPRGQPGPWSAPAHARVAA